MFTANTASTSTNNLSWCHSDGTTNTAFRVVYNKAHPTTYPYAWSVIGGNQTTSSSRSCVTAEQLARAAEEHRRKEREMEDAFEEVFA